MFEATVSYLYYAEEGGYEGEFTVSAESQEAVVEQVNAKLEALGELKAVNVETNW